MANTDTLNSFLNYLNLQDVPNLMRQFCADIPNPNNPKFPCLGITAHGPAFYGVTDITNFFTQLFKTFPDMQWTSPPASVPGAPQLTATNEIGIQMDVGGQYQDQWFQHPGTPGHKDHYSLPLSQLPPKTPGNALSSLPAFAIFTFDGSTSYSIKQLQIYLDRYAMMQMIGLSWFPSGSPPAPAVGATKVVRGERGRSITITIED